MRQHLKININTSICLSEQRINAIEFLIKANLNPQTSQRQYDDTQFDIGLKLTKIGTFELNKGLNFNERKINNH